MFFLSFLQKKSQKVWSVQKNVVTLHSLKGKQNTLSDGEVAQPVRASDS